MKKNNALIFLASVGGLTLSSCLYGSIDGPWWYETSVPSDRIAASSFSSSSVTSEESGPKDELLATGSNDLEKDAEGNYVIHVEEYNEPLKLCKSTTSAFDTLKYGDVTISSALHAGMQLIASDINGDGYREIAFIEKAEDRNRNFVVYDVKNAKTLLRQTDMTVEKYGRFASYNYYHDMRNGRLTFLPYIGNFSEDTVVDYGHLKWSEQKGCYFEWENIYKIKQIVLEGIYLEGEETPMAMDHNAITTTDYYSFEIGSYYLMKYKFIRDDFTRTIGDEYIQLDWSNENPSYLQECYAPRNASHPETGDYVMKFSVREAPEGIRTWDWSFGPYGFSLNYRIMPKANA